MLEVEAKFRCSDWEPVIARLQEWGATGEPVRQDADHYFNAPDRDFATTDEAVRVRQTGPKAVITYKGPKRDAVTKTRTEIELPLAPVPEAATTTISSPHRRLSKISKHIAADWKTTFRPRPNRWLSSRRCSLPRQRRSSFRLDRRWWPGPRRGNRVRQTRGCGVRRGTRVRQRPPPARCNGRRCLPA